MNIRQNPGPNDDDDDVYLNELRRGCYKINFRYRPIKNTQIQKSVNDTNDNWQINDNKAEQQND
jgi:hypothetical protein